MAPYHLSTLPPVTPIAAINSNLPHMGGLKKLKGSRYLPRAFGSVSDSNLAKDPPGGLASGQSSSGPRPEQSSGEHKPQHTALSSPTIGRSSRLLDKFKWRSPPAEVECGNNTTDQPIATSAPQLLAVPGSVPPRPHSLYSGLKTHGPLLHDPSLLIARGDVAAVSSGDHASSLGDHSSDPQCKPIASENTASPSTSTCHIQALAKTGVHAAVLPQMKSTQCPDVIEPSSPSSVVWAKALEIATKKLSDNNLPPLNLTNLTSQSAEENIEAIIKALNTIQEDDKKKRWSYIWHGKEVIVVERLGKILKSMEKYSKVVNTVIQINPQVSALVWAGVWAIMRVRIGFLSVTITIL